jgi:hypothetical protein
MLNAFLYHKKGNGYSINDQRPTFSSKVLGLHTDTTTLTAIIFLHLLVWSLITPKSAFARGW